MAFWVLASCALALVTPSAAWGTPEAHILRIDPRTGMNAGKPTLTSVIEVVQFKRLSDVLAPCAGVTGAATTACWSEQLEKPGALWDAFPFPEANAHMLVQIAGEDTPMTFVDKTQWGKAQNQPNVGTAWLVAVDSSSGMGARFADARAIAHELIEEMQPNDLMDLMFFDDVQTVQDTKWKTFKQRNDLANALNALKATSPSHGADRALFSQIKNMTQDGFGSLGNSDQPDTVPLHQAMVVISDGAGRGDPESASPSADVFHQYLDAGRFPPDNTALPKTPLPVVSIWLPTAASMTANIYRNNDAQFMQALANPEIGGFFDIVNEGQGTPKAKTIIGAVRSRFNAMWLIHWTMSCINSSVDQTFNLVFDNVKPQIAPDGTFKDVPIGIDPTQWPLDVDAAKTVQAAQGNPLYPGGQFNVYGNFCWAGDRTRAEAYFVPAGTSPTTGTRDPTAAQKAMQQLQAEHMLGTAVATGDGYVTFNVPDDPKILNGTGDNAVAHVVIYDNKAHRASAVDAATVLTLKATAKPLSVTLIAGVAGLLVVIVLLVMVLLKGSGGGKKRGGAPPAPQAPPGYGAPPGGGYGAPPPGYGPPPQGGGGYGATPANAAPVLAVEARPASGTEAVGPYPPTAADAVVSSGLGPVVQVRCPACGTSTMASPGQTSFCFSCGQPLPGEMTKGGGGTVAPGFRDTSVLPPPAAPGGSTQPLAARGPNAARLSGTAGEFMIRPGPEVRVGRDPAACSIFLGEPRVSGVHATLKLEAGRLLVRDETSNNGTWVSGERIAPGTWTPLAQGAPLRFGPVEFTVKLEVP
jgi:hypothetical protein